MNIDSTAMRQIGCQPRELVQSYQPSTSFFFATPKYTLLAEGPLSPLAGLREITKKEEILTLISDQWTGEAMVNVKNREEEHIEQKKMIVGALPFDMNVHAQLYLCENVQISAALSKDEIPSEVNMGQDIHRMMMTSVPNEQQYKADVSEAVRLIGSGILDKVVLARTLQVESSEMVRVKPILSALLHQNPQGFTFSVPLKTSNVQEKNDTSASSDQQTQTPVTLLGASPELLVRRTGMEVIANPLAGSIPRSQDPKEDRERAERLLVSSKDLHEHALVIAAVSSALRPFCKHLHVPQKPALVATKTMWHLSTEIIGVLEASSTTSLELAMAMHPTPAVCGSPTKEAKQAIDAIESFDRGYYTGMVGWCDEKGDGEWVVTIRCAEIEANKLRLFAGAGIVAGSKPEDELAETSAKMGTFLQAIGLEDRVREMMGSRRDQ